MRLINDWRVVLKHAWSIRWMAAVFVVQALDAALPLIGESLPLPDGWAPWLTAGFAVAALAVATTGWMFGPTSLLERVLCVPAALLLLYLVPTSIAIGFAVLAVAVLLHLVRRRVRRDATPVEATT